MHMYNNVTQYIRLHKPVAGYITLQRVRIRLCMYDVYLLIGDVMIHLSYNCVHVSRK